MLNFSEYLVIEPELRGFITMVWAYEVLERCGAPSINQIQAFLSKAGDTRSVESRQKSKYWYKKINEEPLRSESEVNRVETLYPGTARVLLHPIWRVFKSETFSNTELLHIASELPFDIQKQILNNQRNKIRAPRFFDRILINNNLDGLCAFLILYHYNPSDDSARTYFSVGAGMLLRMYCRKKLSRECGWKIYMKYVYAFHAHADVFRVLVGLDGSEIIERVDLQLSLYFNLFSNKSIFFAYCDEYSNIIDSIMYKLEKFKKESRALRLMSIVSHGGLHEFQWNLEIYPDHRIQGRYTWLEEAVDRYGKIFR